MSKLKFEASLDNLTVIILSHNRQHCLKEVLKFWEKYNIKTIVLDNSIKPMENFKQYQNCTYIHSQTNFNDRSKKAVKYIKTKYVIVAADDELYLPSALIKMCKFLDENLDYASVGAAVIAVWKYGPKIAASWAYKKTLGYHNQGSNAFERVRYHTGNGTKPNTSFFTCNLTRKEHLINCLNLYGEAPILATDAISILTICTAGKSYYLNELYWIRNWNQFPKSHLGWDRSVYLHEWWIEKKESKEWISFNSSLSKFYKNQFNRQDFNETWQLILNASRILQPHVSKNKYKQGLFKNNQFFLTTMNYYLKKILQRKNLNYTEEILQNMLSNDIKYNRSEAEEAIRIVSRLKPYKNW
jgi:glycosyltransferase domain-containing protein